ncbi:hypothetical protein ACU4GG_43235 [Streptomyces nojiriensis]
MKRAVDVVRVGDRIRFDGRIHVLAGLDGPRCRLLAEEGASVQVLLLTQVLGAQDFEVLDRPRSTRRRVPVHGPLDGLDPVVREKALAWERHILEVETGHVGPRQDWPPRTGYDPAVYGLAEREAAKAAELTAAGETVAAYLPAQDPPCPRTRLRAAHAYRALPQRRRAGPHQPVHRDPRNPARLCPSVLDGTPGPGLGR